MEMETACRDECTKSETMDNPPIQEPEMTGTVNNGSEKSELAEQIILYQTQYLDFSLMSMTDEMYNALIQYSVHALQEAQEIIKNEFPTKLSDADIDKTTDDIINKLVACLQNAFDKLEYYLTMKLFHIPEHVILPDDMLQEKFPNASERLTDINGEIDELKSKIREAKIHNACLERELEDIRLVQNELDQTLSLTKSLRKIMSDERCEELNFVVSKALQLKKLLANLEYTKAALNTDEDEDF